MSTPLEPVWSQIESRDIRRLPVGIIRSLQARDPLVLIGRNSGSSGRRSADYAARDAHGAAAVLFEETGIDVRAMLPDAEDLAERLMHAETQRLGSREAPIRMRYVLIDLSATMGLVVLVGQVSGTKVDEAGTQHWTKLQSEVLRRHGSKALARKEADRTGRVDWGLQPIIQWLRDTDGVIIDARRIWTKDDDLSMFVEGKGHAQVAERIVSNSGRSQVTLTDDRMVAGRAAYHAAAPPPPGFGRATLKSWSGALRDKIVYLDSPGTAPDPADVAFGESEVVDADGCPVDQVAIVQWVLANYGRPEVSLVTLYNGVVARRASTVGLREHHHDTAAYVTSTIQARTYVDSIIDNLDVYRTGDLHRGVIDNRELTIAGCQPDGGWAAKADFDRIDQYRAGVVERHRSNVKLPLVGVKGDWNGEAIRLGLYSSRDESERETRRYGARTDVAWRDARRPADHVPIPVPLLHTGIIDAVVDAADRGIVLELRTSTADSPALAAARAELVRGEAALLEAQRSLENIEQRVEQTDSTGKPMLHGPLLKRESDRYAKLTKQTPTLRTDVEVARGKVARLEAESPPAAPAEDVLDYLRSLTSDTLDDLGTPWTVVIDSLTFTASGGRVDWSGRLTFGVGDEVAHIDFRGDYDPKVERAMDRLAAGESIGTRDQRVRESAAEHLGVDATHPALSAVTDPRIRTVAVGLLTGESREALVDEHGEKLVAAVERVHLAATPPRHWRARVSPILRAACTIARAQDGRVMADEIAPRADVVRPHVHNVMSEACRAGDFVSERKRGYVLQPCDCGSLNRRPSALREVTGLVCGDCDVDSAGVHWPREDYDDLHG